MFIEVGNDFAHFDERSKCAKDRLELMTKECIKLDDIGILLTYSDTDQILSILQRYLVDFLQNEKYTMLDYYCIYNENGIDYIIDAIKNPGINPDVFSYVYRVYFNNKRIELDKYVPCSAGSKYFSPEIYVLIAINEKRSAIHTKSMMRLFEYKYMSNYIINNLYRLVSRSDFETIKDEFGDDEYSMPFLNYWEKMIY